MAQTITPVVHGGRRGPWAGSVALHAIGATTSAAALGAVLALAGEVLGAPWGRAGLVTVAAIAALYAARELGGVPVPLPNFRRQVPEWWRTFFAPPVAAFLYGLGLGIGFLTYLSFGTFVAVSAAAVAVGDPVQGAVLVGAFGAARGLSVLAAYGATTTEGVDRVGARLDALGATRVPRMVNGVALAGVTMVAAIEAWRIHGVGGSLLAGTALAVVFVWAALAKIVRPAAWREALASYHLGAFERVARIATPWAELAVAALVAAGAERAAGALAILLLMGFSGAVLRARRHSGDRLPCGCFGRRRTRDYRAILARNGLLAAMGLAAVIAPHGGWNGLPAVSSTELLPALLAAAGAVLALVMVRIAFGLLDGAGGRHRS